jgi:acyl-CoA synthetase (AMP-forming)/AMP-acid ligase II
VVLAVPDSRRGEAVGAAVACGNGLREADLLDYCRAKLPRHGLPRRWIILPALPRTARGKVDLERLRSLFSAPATGASRTG